MDVDPIIATGTARRERPDRARVTHLVAGVIEAEAAGVGPLGVSVAEATLVAALAVDVGYGAEEAVVVAVGGAAAGGVSRRAARFSAFRSFRAVAIMAAISAE